MLKTWKPTTRNSKTSTTEATGAVVLMHPWKACLPTKGLPEMPRGHVFASLRRAKDTFRD